MHIAKLRLKDFRNYQELDLDLAEGINLFYGDNAQGKTNILESVYLCGTTKSHKGSKDRDIIRLGEQDAHIFMKFHRRDMNYTVDMHLHKGQSKGIAIDRIPIKRATELIGLLPVIFFSPEDLMIIKNGPAERRRFLDMELCQIDHIYLEELTRYNKSLSQRNALLKELQLKKTNDREMLSVWNDLLIEYGSVVIQRREEFLKELNEIFQQTHQRLTGGREKVHLVYEPAVLKEEYREKLEKSVERDILLKTTNVGPHRDEIVFLEGDKDLRTFGSQGQQRTVALALKLSEIELMTKRVGERPILLLDDVFSELDRNRQQYLLESLQNVQTLITCTGLEEFVNQQVQADRIFKVTNGTVEQQ